MNDCPICGTPLDPYFNICPNCPIEEEEDETTDEEDEIHTLVG
jgi:uncharacterized OB-fold protein